MDCLLGSLRCMACGPSEHFARQKAWCLWDVWLCWRQLECWMGLLTFVLAWFKVESVVRKRQYKLRAQFLRLCCYQSSISDAYRAGANRHQNQITSSFFFFEYDSENWTFFDYDSKNWTLLLWIWRKELNLFSNMTQSTELFFFFSLSPRIELFF